MINIKLSANVCSIMSLTPPDSTDELLVEETDDVPSPLEGSKRRLGRFLAAISHNESWYLTWGGMVFGVILTVMTLFAVGVSTSFGQSLVGIALPEAATVPLELYLAGFLGSLAFIWSRIVVGENDLDGDEDTDTEDVTTLMLRRMVLGLFGSLPLVFGVYVLAGVLAITEVGLLGAAFLTGMFVKLIYETFREFVKRVALPSKSEERATGSDGASEPPSVDDTDGHVPPSSGGTTPSS